ncbi:MAG: HigA family addiction module antitoxin [Pseudomonadota bacterium]
MLAENSYWRHTIEQSLDDTGWKRLLAALATAIGVPATHIGQIARGERAITADTDLRLSRYFGTSEGYWLRLQNAYDLEQAKRKGRYSGIRPH